MTKRYEHKYKFLFNFNKCIIISYIMFSGCIWITHSYDNIVSIGLFGYLSCIFLFIFSIFTINLLINTKKPYVEKVSLLERIKLLWKNKNNIKYILCFIIITMFIRYNFFYFTGINIREFTYIPLVSFTVLVTIVPINFIFSVILTIYNGFALSSGIKYATNKVKESINSSSFITIIIMVITICLVKFIAFPFILPYILSMFPTKQGMLHGSYQAESSTKVGKDPDSDPDPEPNKDIHMGNNEDSDDSGNFPDIPSTKWSPAYFEGAPVWIMPFDPWGTYVEPRVDQIPLGTKKDIFASCKGIIEITKIKNWKDLYFDPIEKTWTDGNVKYALINSEKRLVLNQTEAKRIASLS